MDKLTLDTNILRDWIWCEGLSEENRYSNQLQMKDFLSSLFCELKLLSEKKICKLGITTQIYTDCGDSANFTKQLVDKLIGKHIEYGSPSISTFSWVFPIVFTDERIINQIFSIVFPNSKSVHKKYSKNYKDSLQLYAHQVAERDFFLTSDKAILNAQERLQDELEISVLDLNSYITLKKRSKSFSR